MPAEAKTFHASRKNFDLHRVATGEVLAGRLLESVEPIAGSAGWQPAEVRCSFVSPARTIVSLFSEDFKGISIQVFNPAVGRQSTELRPILPG